MTAHRKRGQAYNSEDDLSSPSSDAEIITDMKLKAPVYHGHFHPVYASLTKGKGKLEKIREIRHEDLKGSGALA